MTVAFLEKRLHHSAATHAERARAALGACSAKLNALNPLSVLARGYAAVFDEQERPIVRSEDLKIEQNIRIRFADGVASAVVNDVRESEL